MGAKVGHKLALGQRTTTTKENKRQPYRNRDVERTQQGTEFIQHLAGGRDGKVRPTCSDGILENVLQILGDEYKAMGFELVVKYNLH